MRERFSYGMLGVEQTQVVLEAYEKTQSCLKASMEDGVFASSATVSRAVNAALEIGVLDPESKMGVGRPKIDRQRIWDVVDEFDFATRKQQAALADCQEATVYRALQELQDTNGKRGSR